MKVGEKKNRLTLLRIVGSNKHQKRIGLFLCECGKSKEIVIASVNSNQSRSCGCIKIEQISNLKRSHSLCYSKECHAWYHIKARCYNKECKQYKDYGGRGIKVCDRWLESFENFYEDMGRCPSSKHSIHRIDNDGIYSPENCKWATAKEQNNDRRNSIFLTLNNITKTLSQWSEEINVPYPTLYNRFKRNLTHEQILTIKPSSKNRWKNLDS